MGTKLHVGDIPSTVAKSDLKTTFGKFGPVDFVDIARDFTTGLSKGFAIVAMFRDADAEAAIGRLNFIQYGGRTIDVCRSREGES